VNEQIRATATTAQAAAERGATIAAAPEDSWDRLAALAFGGAASAGGCSEHAHDCTCLAEQAAAGTSWSSRHAVTASEGYDWLEQDEARPVSPEPEPMSLWTPEPREEPEIAD